jgi:hypothetical protein
VTAAQTLDVVHGLVNNMQVVMKGNASPSHIIMFVDLSTIWQMKRHQPMISDRLWVGLDGTCKGVSFLT